MKDVGTLLSQLSQVGFDTFNFVNCFHLMTGKWQAHSQFRIQHMLTFA